MGVPQGTDEGTLDTVRQSLAGRVHESLARRRDNYILVDGIRMRYWDDGEGSPAVLLHGLAASAETWVLTVDALAADHRVLTPDLPGFGLSDKRGFRFTVSEAVRIVASLLAKLDAGPAALVGNSMGGGIALHVALARPELVRRLVLVDSAGLGREVASSLRMSSLPFLDRLLPGPIAMDSLVRNGLRFALSNGDLLPEELVGRMVEMAQLPGAASACYRALRAGVNIFGQRRSIVALNRLAEIRIPTLLVWGRDDPIIPVDHALAAHRLLPNSSLQILEGCRHCPPLEQPDRFNDLVASFI